MRFAPYARWQSRADLVALILVPTQSSEDWRRLLAKPDLHWKEGYSAMTLARSWEAARGLPSEVQRTFEESQGFRGLEPLLIIPEYRVPLPGGRRESQTDVFVLARRAKGLVAIAVEGKVDEAFGPTVAERRADSSAGVAERLAAVAECLGLSDVPGTVRYQLVHRTASAVLAARQYCADTAVMLVHSFSPTDRWFEDYLAFAALFGVTPRIGELVSVGRCGDVSLSIGWCKGDQRFRQGVP